MIIRTWGGIGDILRELSWMPHDTVYRATGWRWAVRHLPPEHSTFHPAAVLPGSDFVRELVERCPSLRWAGQGQGTRTGHLANRGIRQLLWSIGGPRLFPFETRLSEAETGALPARGGGPSIGVQSHLVGLPGKRWPTDRWAAVLRGLAETFPGARLLLLEPSPEGIPLARETGATWCGDLSLFQAMRLVAGLDLLISVDSWSKYIAAGHRVPQVVIVPDQRPDYPQVTADAMWRHSLAGVAGAPGVRLLGIEGGSRGARYTLARIGDLEPAVVLAAAGAAGDRVRLSASASRSPSAG